MKAKLLFVAIVSLLPLLNAKSNRNYTTVKATKPYLSFDSILNKYGRNNFKIACKGTFDSKIKGGTFNYEEIKSSFRDKNTFVKLKTDSRHSILKINQSIFLLDNMKTLPDGWELGKSGLSCESNSLFEVSTLTDTLLCFYASSPTCSGSFCMIELFFVFSKTKRSLAIFTTFPTFHHDVPIIGDVNRDQQPDILLPEVYNKRGNCELFSQVLPMHLHPYEMDSRGNFHPMTDSSGKYIHLKFMVDFPRNAKGHDDFILDYQ